MTRDYSEEEGGGLALVGRVVVSGFDEGNSIAFVTDDEHR
jgi:hypothetical protein